MTDLAQRRLAAVIRQAGSQRAAARSLGVSAAYLNDVLRGRRAVSARLARALGLERVTVYRVKEGE